MTQVVTQAADENNENLGQWSLLITTIVVRLHKPKFRSGHFKRRSFKKRSWYMKTIKWRNKKWRSFYNPKDFNPEDRWNITQCGKLRWIPPQTVSAATFAPFKVIKKKKKINQTPCYYQSQIQSWMCWFQRPIREAFSPNDRSKSNYWRWRCLCEELKAIDSLLPIHEGRDCYIREIV